jgi:hypothetical protein
MVAYSVQAIYMSLSVTYVVVVDVLYENSGKRKLDKKVRALITRARFLFFNSILLDSICC